MYPTFKYKHYQRSLDVAQRNPGRMFGFPGFHFIRATFLKAINYTQGWGEGGKNYFLIFFVVISFLTSSALFALINLNHPLFPIHYNQSSR